MMSILLDCRSSTELPQVVSAISTSASMAFARSCAIETQKPVQTPDAMSRW
jgi:hypothetical protein